MASDGQIVFEVTADGKHAIADIKDITRAIQQETGKWDDAAKQSTDNINKSFSGMLKSIAAGFSAAKIGQALLNIGNQCRTLLTLPLERTRTRSKDGQRTPERNSV